MTDQGSYNAAYLYGFVDGANKALCSEMHALFAGP